jgi:hypothetical protein
MCLKNKDLATNLGNLVKVYVIQIKIVMRSMRFHAAAGAWASAMYQKHRGLVAFCENLATIYIIESKTVIRSSVAAGSAASAMY